jgi:hypothetical protein
MAGSEQAPRRGRPPKYGRPARVVAMTLPEDVIAALRAIEPDLGRAIVALIDGARGAAGDQPIPKVVDVARTGRREALILIDPLVIPALPRCSFIRIAPNRAFIALDPGAGLADLELCVSDRLDDSDLTREQRKALRLLRATLKRWRCDPGVTVSGRSIVILEGEVA